MSELRQIQINELELDDLELDDCEELDMYFDEIMSGDEIDKQIILERNTSMHQLHQDLEDISEISLQMKELILEQGEDLEQASEQIVQTEDNIQESEQELEQAVTLTEKIKGWMGKGALVSTGVTGVGAATMFANPIVGGVGMIMGLGGIVFCVLQMK